MLPETILLVAGACGWVIWLLLVGPVIPRLLRPRILRDLARPLPAEDRPAPLVSVVVPACNEGPAIRQCLASLLSQDYAPLEIIAVDDRSTDATGAIMDEMICADRRLRVVHIKALPPGWLGKNHANEVGQRRAEGEWLLFTDGDVFFEPDCIGRAMARAQGEQLDHLCLFPGLICGGFLEKAACCTFGLVFLAYLKPWHARDPRRPDAFCGVGAFNLVRRSAYEKIGSHRRLRLEVGDDVKLGQLIKQAGFASEALGGAGLLRVRWQHGLGGVIAGLEKNAFAGAQYRLSKALFGAASLAGVVLVPIAGLALCSGPAFGLHAAWLAAQMAVLSLAAVRSGFSPWIGLAFPIASLALAWAIGRSTLLTLWRGGIAWRGSFYPLSELRQASGAFEAPSQAEVFVGAAESAPSCGTSNACHAGSASTMPQKPS